MGGGAVGGGEKQLASKDSRWRSGQHCDNTRQCGVGRRVRSHTIRNGADLVSLDYKRQAAPAAWRITYIYSIDH